MKEIITQFSGEVSRALRNNEASADASATLEALRDAGATIEPLHSGSDDPRLSRWFVVRVQDDQQADSLARRLRSTGPAEAAYIKPHEEAPS